MADVINEQSLKKFLMQTFTFGKYILNMFLKKPFKAQSRKMDFEDIFCLKGSILFHLLSSCLVTQNTWDYMHYETRYNIQFEFTYQQKYTISGLIYKLSNIVINLQLFMEHNIKKMICLVENIQIITLKL